MADTTSQNGTNNRGQSSSTTGQLPRQSSVSNSLLEKARKIQAEFQQIDQQIEEIQQQDQFVLTKITDFGEFWGKEFGDL
jgi:peptidoglycan hydrolase CwlO-like protein